jgi:hypothetical protein
MIRPRLLQLKFAKFGPVFESARYVLLSVDTYALLSGWRYAVGSVLLLLMHEMGHHIAVRLLGMNVGLPTFHTR